MSGFTENYRRLREAIGASDFDAVLLTSPENIFYVTGFHVGSAIVLATKDAGLFATDFRYAEDAARHIDAMPIYSTADRPYKQIVNDFLHAHGAHTLAFEGSLRYEDYVNAVADLDAQLVACGSLVTDLRRIKQPFEIERLIAAQRIAEQAFDDILGFIKPGLSERAVALELYNRLIIRGGERLSFSSIVVSGENGSLCHGVPGLRVINPGEFVTLDFGCVSGGYCSDMTRTVAVGEPSDEMRKVYGIVLDAQNAAIAAARPGIIGRDLDAVARKVITDAGYGEFFGHGLGHGLGILVHDTDGASPRNTRVLPEGTVTTIEPGIYLPGKFGVRIEDVVILKCGGCENITKAPKNLIVL